MRDSLRALRLVLSTAVRADPRRAVVVLLLEPASAMLQPVLALWLKLLADGVADRDQRAVTVAALAFAGSLAAMWLVGGVGNRMRLTFAERVAFAFDRRMAELSGLLPTLEHQERADYQDQLALLREHQGALSGSVHAVVQGARVLVLGVVTGVLLVSLHPVLLLLPLFAVPSLLVLTASHRLLVRSEEAAASSRRLANHLYDLTLRPGAGKELRVFGLRDDVVRRHRAAWLDAHHLRAAAQWRVALWSTAAWAVFAAGFVGAVALVAWRAANGQATAGDVLLAIALARQVDTSVTQSVYAVAGVQQSLRTAARFLWLVDFAARRTPDGRGRTAPDRLVEGIGLDRVSFQYPGTDTWALRDVSLHLAPGQVVAVVGDNGAGKTSLVKLLCGLYEPTEGRVLVDGTDLRELDLTSWRLRLAAAFQDFVRWELVARESVGVGDVSCADPAPAVTAALARAGAGDLPAALPDGLDTQLGRTWDGGVELSAGQWQKVALARSLMRPRPLLLVLDEPTASLDATTEHEVFERIVDAAGRADGAVTLLVSHRFSTVRAADLILVVDQGRVVESGTHDELVARGGLYAELYGIQAAAYR